MDLAKGGEGGTVLSGKDVLGYEGSVHAAFGFCYSSLFLFLSCVYLAAFCCGEVAYLGCTYEQCIHCAFPPFLWLRWGR